jgi:hypothetical protein
LIPPVKKIMLYQFLAGGLRIFEESSTKEAGRHLFDYRNFLAHAE